MAQYGQRKGKQGFLRGPQHQHQLLPSGPLGVEEQIWESVRWRRWRGASPRQTAARSAPAFQLVRAPWVLLLARLRVLEVHMMAEGHMTVQTWAEVGTRRDLAALVAFEVGRAASGAGPFDTAVVDTWLEPEDPSWAVEVDMKEHNLVVVVEGSQVEVEHSQADKRAEPARKLEEAAHMPLVVHSWASYQEEGH